MDLFWQITLVELLLNIAVFATAAIAYGPLRALAADKAPRHKLVEGASVGVLFGIATSTALLLPVHLEGGAAVGCQTVLLALAGPLGGYAAAGTALALSLAAEFLPGPETVTTVHLLSSVISAAAGVALHRVVSRRSDDGEAAFNYRHLPMLGGLTAAGGALATWLADGSGAAAAALVPALVTSVPAVVVLGILLLHEQRRHRAECALRESQRHLALQAQEIAAARDTAEAASRAKSAFLANMSHELRTPLNAILGHAQMLRAAGPGSGADVRHGSAARTIQHSGEHLLLLINDVLDLSQIEAGKFELVEDEMELRPMIEGALDMLRLRANEKGLMLQLEIGGGLPSVVRADGKRLRQVLLNLLSNAVKFTDAGSVTLRVGLLMQQPGRAYVRFEVIDSGVGIPKEQVAAIFEPFEQVGERRRRVGGTGLGLSISRKIVQMMGSDIEVRSTPGAGSRFWFDAWLEGAVPAAAHALPAVAADAASPARLLAPSGPQLQRLHDAALAGNMRRLRQEADGLEAADARYRPFAQRLRQLAGAYQSKAVLQLIEEHISAEETARSDP